MQLQVTILSFGYSLSISLSLLGFALFCLLSLSFSFFKTNVQVQGFTFSSTRSMFISHYTTTTQYTTPSTIPDFQLTQFLKNVKGKMNHNMNHHNEIRRRKRGMELHSWFPNANFHEPFEPAPNPKFRLRDKKGFATDEVLYSSCRGIDKAFRELCIENQGRSARDALVDIVNSAINLLIEGYTKNDIENCLEENETLFCELASSYREQYHTTNENHLEEEEEEEEEERQEMFFNGNKGLIEENGRYEQTKVTNPNQYNNQDLFIFQSSAKDTTSQSDNTKNFSSTRKEGSRNGRKRLRVHKRRNNPNTEHFTPNGNSEYSNIISQILTAHETKFIKKQDDVQYVKEKKDKRVRFFSKDQHNLNADSAHHRNNILKAKKGMILDNKDELPPPPQRQKLGQRSPYGTYSIKTNIFENNSYSSAKDNTKNDLKGRNKNSRIGFIEEDDLLSSLMIEVDDIEDDNIETKPSNLMKNIEEEDRGHMMDYNSSKKNQNISLESNKSDDFIPSSSQCAFPSPMLTSTEKFALQRWINTINLVLQLTQFLPRQMIMEEEEAMIMHNIKILLHAMKKEKDPYSLLDPGLRPPLSKFSPTSSTLNRRENASNKITVPARFLSITQVACLCILELSRRKEELAEYRKALQGIIN